MSDSQNPQPTPEPGDTTPPPPPAPEPATPIGYAGPSTGPVIPKDSTDRTMGMLCHLLAFSGHFIPLGHIIGPLVLWLIKKDDSPFVDDQGKESLNFQITMTIAGVVAGILALVLIGFILLPIIWIADVVLVIVATVKASQGIAYRYPFCLRLIK